MEQTRERIAAQAGAARVAGELPRGDDRRPGKRRQPSATTRSSPTSSRCCSPARTPPRTRWRGRSGRWPRMPEVQARWAEEAREVLGDARHPDRVRDGRGAPLRRGRPARVDAAEAGGADHGRRAARRHRGRGRPGPRRNAARCSCTATRACRDVERARRVPAGALARGDGSRRPTRSPSSPSAPVPASAPAATSPSSRRRRRWR